MDLRQLQILCNLPAKGQSLILLFWNLGWPFCLNGDEAVFVTHRVGHKKPPTFTECSWNTVSGSSEAPEVCGNSDQPSTEASWRETANPQLSQPPAIGGPRHGGIQELTCGSTVGLNYRHVNKMNTVAL